MGEPVRFEVSSMGGGGGHYVGEEGSAVHSPISFVGTGSGERAKKYAAHLNREHRGGRVAQSTCRHGVPCDFDRVNWTPASEAQRARLILCPDHAGKVAA